MRRAVLPVAGVSLVIVGLAGLAVSIALMPGTGAGRRAGGSATDAMFIERMIPHHDDAIAMAELALTRAEHPELRQLAADIKRTQTAENEQMREWYRDWYGSEVPEVGRSPGMMGGMMGSVDLENLEAAEQFDKAFIEEMIPHHRMAIMMASMAGRATNRPQMRELTSTIIEDQSREIDMMREWYDEWYAR